MQVLMANGRHCVSNNQCPFLLLCPLPPSPLPGMQYNALSCQPFWLPRVWRACVRRGAHYGRGSRGVEGEGGGRSVCLTGQQGQHCRWLLTMSNNKSNKQQYFLHFIQFIVCVTFFLSFVTNPHSALAQAKCAKEREREGRVDCRVQSVERGEECCITM